VVFPVLRYARVLLVTAAFVSEQSSPSEEVLRAQGTNKPAIPPQPRTINLVAARMPDFEPDPGADDEEAPPNALDGDAESPSLFLL
jgi:hypothetical protein